MARYKGSSGKVEIGTSGSEVTLCVTEWTLKHHVDESDVTDTCSAGKREFEGNLEHCEFSFKAFWNAGGKKPFGASPTQLRAGSTASVLLYAKAADGNPVFECATAFIGDVDVTSAVADTINYTVTGKSSGDFTLDDGGT